MHKQIIKLTIPYIITNITVPLLSLIDKSLMGNEPQDSTIMLGAVGLGGAIFHFIYWGLAFLRMSTAGITAQAFGRDDHHGMTNTLSRSFVVAMILGCLLLILREPIGWLCFQFIQGSAEVEQAAQTYYNIRILAAPAVLGVFSLTGWMIGRSMAKTTMIITILINVINILLSYVMVRFEGMGIAGVAWGTLIAQYAGLVMCLVVAFRNQKDTITQITWSKIFEKVPFYHFIKQSGHMFIRLLGLMLVLTYHDFESALYGNKILGINQVLIEYIFLFSFGIDGFAYAAESLIGKAFGAKDWKAIPKLIKALFMWCAGGTTLYTILYILAGSWIFSSFTNDHELIEMAQPYLPWAFMFPLISFTAFVWDGVYIGANAFKLMRNSVVMAAILYFVTYYISRVWLADQGLWLALLLFFACRGLLQTFWYSKILTQGKVLS